MGANFHRSGGRGRLNTPLSRRATGGAERLSKLLLKQQGSEAGKFAARCLRRRAGSGSHPGANCGAGIREMNPHRLWYRGAGLLWFSLINSGVWLFQARPDIFLELFLQH